MDSLSPSSHTSADTQPTTMTNPGPNPKVKGQKTAHGTKIGNSRAPTLNRPADHTRSMPFVKGNGNDRGDKPSLKTPRDPGRSTSSGPPKAMSASFRPRLKINKGTNIKDFKAINQVYQETRVQIKELESQLEDSHLTQSQREELESSKKDLEGEYQELCLLLDDWKSRKIDRVVAFERRVDLIRADKVPEVVFPKTKLKEFEHMVGQPFTLPKTEVFARGVCMTNAAMERERWDRIRGWVGNLPEGLLDEDIKPQRPPEWIRLPKTEGKW